jgi:hypothetical protein
MAGEKTTEQILDDIEGFEPVGQVGHPIAHMLFVHVILVLKIAYRFP